MTSEYQEISSNKLLDASKDLILKNDFQNANFYLNLVKYSGNNEYIGVKIQVLYNLSIIYKKNKSDIELLMIGSKLLNWVESLDLKRYNEDVITIIIQIFLNCVDILEEKNRMIFAAWILFFCKNISIKNAFKNKDINDKIQTTFPKIIKYLNDDFTNNYIDLKSKKTNCLNINEQYKKFKSLPEKPFKKGDKVYLINKKWLNSMIEFNKAFNNENIKSDKLFSANNVCLLYFEKNIDEDETELNGVFPGPINNFFFCKQKFFWYDPVDTYTNTFLKKDVSEKNEYELIDIEQYKIINFYFENNAEIERYIIDDEKNCEINLFEFKVLYINEYLRERSKEHLIPKSMQMSHNSTIKELKDKIERCFIYFAKQQKYEDYDFEYRIYLIEFKKKDIVEMIISYNNVNKSFKIKCEDLNEIDLNKKITEIINKKILIICEAISKNSIVKPFLKKFNNIYHCSLCNFKIEDSSKIIHCSHCSQSIYCSENCKNNDYQHLEFHKKIANLYEASLQTSEIQNINLNAFLNEKSKHGLVGIRNLGGIDFLLSAIQVLSHCNSLTKFILSNNYLDSNGNAKDDQSLVQVYAELINKLWVGSNTEINITHFRNLFFSMLKDISSQQNIDAFDILIVILDKLHTELNEIKNRNNEDSYNFYEQLNGESDRKCCSRWWKAHTSMNKSIIIDLFQGQLKMKIKCPFCKSVSITYPPFLYFGLPIPNKEEFSKIHFRVFPYDFEYKYINVELFDVNKFTSVKDIKKRIKEYKKFKKSKIECMLFKDCELVKILDDDVLIFDYIFTRYNFSDEVFIEWEISFIEVPDNINGDLINFYITPINFEEEKGWFSTTKKINALTYSKVFSMNQRLTLKDLNKEIFKYYRRSMDDMVRHDEEGNLDDTYYTDFYKKLNDDSFIENEYSKINKEESFFDLYFYHNLEKSDSWFYSGPKCEFCNISSDKSSFCQIKLPQSTPLKEILLKQQISRPIFILVDFEKFKENFNQFYTQLEDDTDPRLAMQEEINIYDCFDISKKEERLKKEKDYICPKCSRRVEPYKAMETFKAPEYLILNIKRIKKKFDDLMDMLNNKKDETLVGYTLDGLDLTSYFPGEDEEIIYDLSSILCHMGNIKNAHYKAIVRNEDEWYDINDTNIKKIEKEEVVTKDAYVLVYKKRECESKDKKKIKEEDELLKNPSINDIKTIDFGEMKNI